MRISRDPFTPIMSVLRSENPLRDYRAIADRVERTAPNPKEMPVAAAESARAYLVLRFGMHWALRQRNLRELLLCPRGKPPKASDSLELPARRTALVGT